MTQAQKTAKAKFKQAIAYRTKTGVSLKEAFAHIYGKKKVVKKAAKKRVVKKAAPKKIAKKKVVKKATKKIGAVKKKPTETQVLKSIQKAVKTQKSHMGKIGTINTTIINDIKVANDKLTNWQKILLELQFDKKEFPMSARIINIDIKRVKEAIKEQKAHISQLKKNIK